MYKLIALFIFFSFSVMAITPCPGKSGLDIIDNAVFSDLSFTRCVDEDSDDFDEENICNCLSSFELEGKPVRPKPSVDPVKEIGEVVVGKIFVFTNLLGELDTLNSINSFSQDLSFSDSNSCNLNTIVSGLSCASDTKKIEAIFESLFKAQDRYFMKDSSYQGPQSIANRIGEYFETLKTGKTKNSIKSHSSCLSPKDSYDALGYMLKEELTTEALMNHSVELPAFSILELMSPRDPKIKSLLEKYQGDEFFKSPDVYSVIQDKLDTSCLDLKQDLDNLICKQDTSVFSKSKDNFLFDLNPLDTSESSLMSLQGNLKWFCEDNDVKTTGEFLNDNYGVDYSHLYKEAAVELGISENKKLLDFGICEDICEDPSTPYDIGGCKQKDIDIVFNKVGCNQPHIEDLEVLDKCAALSAFKEHNTKLKIARVLNYEDTKLSDDPSFGPSSSKKKSQLLNSFLAAGNMEKPAKPQIYTTAQVTKSNVKGKDDVEGDGQAKGEALTISSVKNKEPNHFGKENRQPLKVTMSTAKRPGGRNSLAQNTLSFSKSNNSKPSSLSNRYLPESTSSKEMQQRKLRTQKLSALTQKLEDLKTDNKRFERLVNRKKREASARGNSDELSSNQIRRLTKYDDYGLAINPAQGAGSKVGHSRYALGNSDPFQRRGEQLRRSDMFGRKANGVSSIEDGDQMIQASFNQGADSGSQVGNSSSLSASRRPSSLGSGASSAISKVFSGQSSPRSITSSVQSDIVEVQVPSSLKEVKLEEVLKSRNEITPGQPFIIYERYNGKKVRVKLLPTFSYSNGRQVFTGYRALKNSRNSFLVNKLKAAKNLLIQL